jgi:class 3 adenylate cyclase
MRDHLSGNSNTKLRNLLKETEDRFQEIYETKKKLDRRYREAHLLADVIQRISAGQEPEELIQITLEEVRQKLLYDRVIYLSFDKESKLLSVAASDGFEPKQKSKIKSYSIDLSEVTSSPAHLGNVFKAKKSILIPVTADYFNTLSEEGRIMLYLTKSKSFLMCTVATAQDSFGMLLVDYADDARILSQDDLNIIQNVSNQLAISLSNAYAFAQERKMRKAFQKFVPTQVIQAAMGEGTEKFQDGGTKQVTVVFSDIRAFSHRSLSSDPILFLKALNYYLKTMVDIIYAHGGIVDKFTGDGIMALFNAFGNDPKHINSAVSASFEMQKKLSDVNRWIQEHIFKDIVFQPFDVGIGIHTGEAIIGNVGTDQKTEFTAIGKTVNISARLVELSKKYPLSILISEEVKKGCSGEFEIKVIGPQLIRGMGIELEVSLVVVGDSKSNLSEKSSGIQIAS